MPERELNADGVVAVVNRETDLVHVRTAETPLARKVCKTIARSIGIDYNKPDIFYKPQFDQEFLSEFKTLIETHINLSVRVSEENGRTASSVKFTSKKTEGGEYMDLIEDDKVQEELENGTFSRGYVRLNIGKYGLGINRPQSKIHFKSHEPEDRLNKIEELINDVLQQSRGYPQTKIQGFENIPD
jgi:hypothetical protein